MPEISSCKKEPKQQHYLCKSSLILFASFLMALLSFNWSCTYYSSALQGQKCAKGIKLDLHFMYHRLNQGLTRSLPLHPVPVFTFFFVFITLLSSTLYFNIILLQLLAYTFSINRESVWQSIWISQNLKKKPKRRYDIFYVIRSMSKFSGCYVKNKPTTYLK